MTDDHWVPPTASAYGVDAGSSTASAVEPLDWRQDSEPKSPVAASTVSPCAAACSKVVFSAAASPPGSSASHCNQLVLMTDASSASTIRVHWSSQSGVNTFPVS